MEAAGLRAIGLDLPGGGSASGSTAPATAGSNSITLMSPIR